MAVAFFSRVQHTPHVLRAGLGVLLLASLLIVPAAHAQQSSDAAGDSQDGSLEVTEDGTSQTQPRTLTAADSARIDSLELQASFAAVAENHDVVVRNLTKVMEIMPGDSSHYYRLGQAYDGLWEYAKAADAYQEAIDRGMDTPDAHLERATSLVVSRQYADALPIIEDFLESNPSSISLRTTYAVALSGLGRASEAVEDMNTLHNMYPDAASIMARYTETLWVAGAHQRAFDTIQAYIEKHPEESFPYTLLAEMHLRVGRVDAGHAAFLKARERLKQRSSYVRGIVNSGLTYTLAQNGQPSEALEQAEAAIEQVPNNPYLYRNRGLAYLAGGQREAACASFHESLERGYERLFLQPTQFGPEPSALIEKHCR